MFDDLNRSIEVLLKAGLPSSMAGQVAISFATPDESFPPQGLTLPAINFFLFEIRENLSLREIEPLRERRTDGTTLLAPAPVHMDCHYVVSAVAASQLGSEMEEHRILGAALCVLLRYRVFPVGVLQGSLAGKTPPIRAATARQGVDARPSGIELWQALKGKPRASLHYALTVAVDVGVPEEMAPPVLTLNVGGA